MEKIQAQKEGKIYSNIYKEEWTQPWPMGSKKSTLRFMRTLGPSLAALVQSSWSLLFNTIGDRIASKVFLFTSEQLEREKSNRLIHLVIN